MLRVGQKKTEPSISSSDPPRIRRVVDSSAIVRSSLAHNGPTLGIFSTLAQKIKNAFQVVIQKIVSFFNGFGRDRQIVRPPIVQPNLYSKSTFQADWSIPQSFEITMEKHEPVFVQTVASSSATSSKTIVSTLKNDFIEEKEKPSLEAKQPVYTNNFENREFDKEAPQNSDLERVTIAREQGASEDQNFEVKPMPSKTDFRSCLGIGSAVAQNEASIPSTTRVIPPLFWPINDVVNPYIYIDNTNLDTSSRIAPIIPSNQIVPPDNNNQEVVLTLAQLNRISNAIPLLNTFDGERARKEHLHLYRILPEPIQHQFLEEFKKRYFSDYTPNIEDLFHSYHARHLLNHSVSCVNLNYSIKSVQDYLNEPTETDEHFFAKLLTQDQVAIRPGGNEMDDDDIKAYLKTQEAVLQTFEEDQPFYYFKINARVAD